jgi:hypothetical protein
LKNQKIYAIITARKMYAVAYEVKPRKGNQNEHIRKSEYFAGESGDGSRIFHSVSLEGSCFGSEEGKQPIL